MKQRANICCIIVFLACTIISANGANILGVFPSPSPSHHILGSALLKELAKKGHNVTMYSPFKVDEPIANYTDVTLQNMNQIAFDMVKDVLKTKSFREQMSVYMNVYTSVYKTALEQEVSRNFVESKDNRFDVILYDSPGGEPLYGFMDYFDAPGILFSPFGDLAYFAGDSGNWFPLAYIPAVDLVTDSDLESFSGRLKNFVQHWVRTWVIGFTFYTVTAEMHEKYFPDAPSLFELKNRIAVLLLNSHFSYESARPYTPNVIQIGGFNMVNMKPIEPAIQNWLDEADQGVIVVSFGTKVNGNAVVNEEQSKIFLNTFRKLKYKVLWKFGDDLENVPANVRMEKWIQQREILNHPNVKIFITHGGMGGFTEAIYAGVPMIVMPFYGDQIRNAMTTVEFGYGVRLNWADVTETSLEIATKQVTENPKYARNIQIASDTFRNQLINPLDKAVFYIEHVIKYKGASHLKPASLKLSLVQELLLDVIGFLLIVTSLVMYLMYFCLKRTIRYFWRPKIKTN